MIRPSTAEGIEKSQRSDDGRLPALDGLRGLAILMVMAHHFTVRGVPEGTSAFGRAALKLMRSGWAGVDLFFVLSGFLITGLLLEAKGRPAYFRRFFTRRALRILPLYYGVLAGLFIVLPLTGLMTADHVRSAAGMQFWYWGFLSNVGAAFHLTPNNVGGWFDLSHFWSLAVEEHFYLLWPFVVWANDDRRLIRICLAGLALGPVSRFAFLHLGLAPDQVYFLTPCRLDGLSAGALLAVQARTPDVFARLARAARRLTPVLMAASVFLFLRQRTASAPVVEAVKYLTLSVLFAMILLRGVSGDSRFIGPLCRLPLLRTFGKYSFGLYVLHQLLAPFLDGFVPARSFGVVPHLLAAGAVSFALAFLSWHLYEKHFVALKSRLAPRPVASTP